MALPFQSQGLVFAGKQTAGVCASERLLGKAITGSSRIKIHQWLRSRFTEASGNKVKIISMTCRN